MIIFVILCHGILLNCQLSRSHAQRWPDDERNGFDYVKSLLLHVHTTATRILFTSVTGFKKVIISSGNSLTCLRNLKRKYNSDFAPINK